MTALSVCISQERGEFFLLKPKKITTNNIVMVTFVISSTKMTSLNSYPSTNLEILKEVLHLYLGVVLTCVFCISPDEIHPDMN